jgi:acetylornithine/N-succinyldiaminopimelate aminotransferase
MVAAMTNQQVIALTDENIMPTYARFPIAIEKGNGSTLWDFEGKKYIDFTSGIGVNSLGYGNEKWLAALTGQAGKLPHLSNLFYTEPAAKLAAELARRSGLKKAFFCNSGAEANEGAIKLARKYSFDKYGSGRNTIVTLNQSFHGRTITTLAATGQDVFHNYFYPFTEGFKYTPANDTEALTAALTDDVCALMLEPVQGEGGVLPLDGGFISTAEKLCREKDILLILDEVQTGIGRTGTLFCFQQFGIEPDVCSFAKGIAGGLPFGGILAGIKCADILSAGTHATTFGGNPICAAAALTVLDILSQDFLEEVKAKGRYIRSEIEKMKLPVVKGIRGLGLMIGVAVTGSHKALCLKLIENGLLSLTAGGDALRFLPPLTISYDEINEGLDIIKNTLK